MTATKQISQLNHGKQLLASLSHELIYFLILNTFRTKRDIDELIDTVRADNYTTLSSTDARDIHAFLSSLEDAFWNEVELHEYLDIEFDGHESPDFVVSMIKQRAAA